MMSYSGIRQEARKTRAKRNLSMCVPTAGSSLNRPTDHASTGSTSLRFSQTLHGKKIAQELLILKAKATQSKYVR